jgi:hypothetical protein
MENGMSLPFDEILTIAAVVFTLIGIGIGWILRSAYEEYQKRKKR